MDNDIMKKGSTYPEGTLAGSVSVQEGSVADDVAVLQSRADSLHSAIDRLEKVLDPVVHHFPVDSATDLSSPGPARVELASRISTSNEYIRGATNRINSLVDRLGL